jgi:hypothetical protein
MMALSTSTQQSPVKTKEIFALDDIVKGLPRHCRKKRLAATFPGKHPIVQLDNDERAR